MNVILSTYLVGVITVIIVYLAAHSWTFERVDWLDILIVLLWPVALLFLLYKILFYGK